MKEIYSLPSPLKKLVRSLSKLPSVGERTAARLAYFLITQDKEVALNLIESLQEASDKIKLCEQCFFLAENSLCQICSDTSRDVSLVCVVEKPVDLLAIEKMGEYRGVYHVLHGLWAPLKGVGVSSIRVRELMDRVQKGAVKEVILATGSTVEGDATAMYLAKCLSDQGITSTRLAQGMPKGGELEYADTITISRAFSGRA